MARLLHTPKYPIPSPRRDEGMTSMATVLLATLTMPKEKPCKARITAKVSIDAANR